MNLRQRLKRMDRQVANGTELKASRHLLESLMRYFLIHRHLMTVIKLGHKTREEMSSEEWADFCKRSVEYFNANKRRYSESDILGYIEATTETLPEYIAAFIALPDRSDYEH